MQPQINSKYTFSTAHKLYKENNMLLDHLKLLLFSDYFMAQFCNICLRFQQQYSQFIFYNLHQAFIYHQFTVSGVFSQKYCKISMATANIKYINGLTQNYNPFGIKNKHQNNKLEYCIKFNRMRRRSGGIHCQSQQEFIQLAEKSLETTGLFYDDKYNKHTISEQKNSKKQQKSNNFDEFDYKEEDQFIRDQRSSNQQFEKQQGVNIANVIICENTSQVRSIVDHHTLTKQQVFNRQIDLVVRRCQDKDGKQYIFKYWLIQHKMSESTLAQIYISAANKIYCLLQEIDNKMDHKIQMCNLNQINHKIYKDEQELIFL